jgi:hypothetical protein
MTIVDDVRWASQLILLLFVMAASFYLDALAARRDEKSSEFSANFSHKHFRRARFVGSPQARAAR